MPQPNYYRLIISLFVILTACTPTTLEPTNNSTEVEVTQPFRRIYRREPYLGANHNPITLYTT